MKLKELTKNAAPIVRIDDSLSVYKAQPLFQQKVDKANKTLSEIALPKKRSTKPKLSVYKPNKNLADVIGPKPITRSEASRRLWEYVKQKQLQNPLRRIYIVANAPLRKVFGGKKTVTMFELEKLLSKNLSKQE